MRIGHKLSNRPIDTVFTLVLLFSKHSSSKSLQSTRERPVVRVKREAGIQKICKTGRVFKGLVTTKGRTDHLLDILSVSLNVDYSI